MAEIFLGGRDMVVLSHAQLKRIKAMASKAPLRRARFCLHTDHRDKVQEMVIAFCKDSYVPPHRHRRKSESYHVIEGELEVVFFDDAGRVTRRLAMAAHRKGRPFLYRLSSPLWHTMVPRSKFVVLHETAAGPFVKSKSDLATWAPDPSDQKGVRAFLKRIGA